MYRLASTHCLTWIFALLSAVFLAGCQDRPEAEKAAPPAAAGPPAGGQSAPAPDQGAPLELLRFGPAGEVPKLNQVTAMFNQPMAALGDYENVPAGALTIVPPVEGDCVWLNQYTLAFIPKAPLTGSRRLTARLDPARFTALSGARLTDGAEIEIRLPDLGILESRQLGGPPLDEDQALTPRWRVTFNQEPDLADLAAKFRFAYDRDEGEAAVPARVKKVESWGAAGVSFEFTAREKLPRAVKYRLVLEAGVKSLAGPEPSARMVIDEGATYGPLAAAVAGLDEDGRHNPAHDLQISFSNPVRIADILPHIRLNNGYDLTPLMQEFAPSGGEDESAVDGSEAGDAASDGADDEYEAVDGLQDYLFIPGGFKAGAEYTLTIDGRAEDIFGQTLGQDVQIRFGTGEYDAYLSLSGDYGLLETATEPAVRLTASNIKEARLEGFALTVDQAVKFLAACDYSPYFYGDTAPGDETLKALDPVKTTIPVPGGARHGARSLPVDLRKMFGEQLQGRLIYLRAGWPVKDGGDGQTREQRTFALVQVSDIGLAVKVGPESSLIWTTDLAAGASWPGVELELRDREARVLWRGISDAQGLATLPGADELVKELGDQEPGLFVAARAAGQMSLWNVNWNEGLETWRWNMTTGEALNRAPAPDHWLISALPLYKPGETAKIKIIARQHDGDRLRDLADKQLTVEIRDAAYDVVNTAVLTTGPFGTASHEVNIPENAALGQWTVHLGRPGEDSRYWVGDFLVMTYRAPAFEVKLAGQPQDAVSGGRAELTVKADYHFGAPVAGQPARYSVSVSPADFRLPGDWADYSLVNRFSHDDDYDDTGYGYQEPSIIVASGEMPLDGEGAMKIPLDLTPAPDQKPAPRIYETSVTVTDVDQRPVSAADSFLAHPAAVYAGLASDQYVAEAGRPYQVKVIVADHQGRLQPGREVTAALYRRTWRNVRRKSPGAAYEYVSRMVDEKVSETRVVSGDMPAGLELFPEKPGYYWVLAEVRDDQGRVNQAALDFYVSGGGPVGWRLNNDDRLTLVADKKEYLPGQTARIMVQSPFEQGQGLLTVERAGVRQSRVFTIDSQTPVLEVPLTENDAPNVFVSVLLARGRIAEQPDESGLDFGKPAIRLGYTELKIPSAKDVLKVEVTPSDTEVAPGAEVDVSIAVTDDQGRPFSEAEVALIAADAAVIQLAGDAAYFPGRQYHRDRPLRVQTADNLVSLIGRQSWGQKGDNPGGGGGDSPLAAALQNQADDVRRAFSALAWFEPRAALDTNGRTTVTIKMPENLTTFKIFAVATGHGRRAGTGTSSVLVTRDLLIRSALPGYAGVGDEFAAAMVVSNRGAKAGQAAVTLTGENITLLDDAQKTVTVEPGQSREVPFRVKAGAAGRAVFRFTVAMGGDRDDAEFAIPVSPPNQLTTQASYERLIPGEQRTELVLAEGLDHTRGGLSLELSPSLMGVLSEPFDWLREYPHACVEQTASKGYASLIRLRLKDRLEAAPEKARAAREHVGRTLNLLTRWEYGGGYNFWPNMYDWQGRSVYLTAYVLDFMLSAREEGFELPDPGIIGRLTSFLKGALSGKSEEAWPAWFSDRAVREARSYALAMLSRAGENVAAYIEVLYSGRDGAGLFELVNLTRAIAFQPPGGGRDGQIADVLPRIAKYLNVTAGEIQAAEPPEGAPEIWSSAVRTTAMTLTALCEAAPESDLMPAMVRWLVSASRDGHFGTTQNNVAALNALSRYVQIMEPENPDLTVMARLGETVLAKASFKAFADPAVAGTAALSDAPSEAPAVTYQVEGRGQAWASLKMKSAPAAPDLSPASSGGYRLSRSFTVVAPEAGAPGVSAFKRGEVVRVSVTMMVPAPRHDTVLVDRVPAGFEPINFNLADADRTLLGLTAGDEEDRGPRFWYTHQEIWPDRVAVYADRLSAGVYTFSYLARAVTPGVYITPGPRAEEMYAPEIFGRGEGQILTVE